MTKLEKWLTKLPKRQRLAAEKVRRRHLRCLPYEDRLRLYAEEKVTVLKKSADLPAPEMAALLLALQEKYNV